MKEIQLTQGQVAKVSDHRFEYLSQWKWTAAWSENSQSYYAYRKQRTIFGIKTVHMHREIMGAPDGVKVDHRDHDTLNNQDENLRLATDSQSVQNRRIPRNNTSGYKGVSWHKRDKRWRVDINMNNKQISLGTFDDPKEGARVYDEKARELFGEFAELNFP